MPLPLFPPAPRSLPMTLCRALDSHVPFALKRRLVEPWLNRAFARPLAEGEFDDLEGRRVALAIDESDIGLTLILDSQRLALSKEPGEVTIRGGWREFLCLATRREDPDSLFFQRRLVIEGDTELGLTVKNLLDGLEEGIAQGRLGELLCYVESRVRQ